MTSLRWVCKDQLWPVLLGPSWARSKPLGGPLLAFEGFGHLGWSQQTSCIPLSLPLSLSHIVIMHHGQLLTCLQ